MKIPGAQKARGSFGIPEHMNPELLATEVRKEERALVDNGQPGAVFAGDPEFSPETMPALATDTSAKAEKELNDEAAEKIVDICYNPKTKKQFTAVFKTLTGDEYDYADELLAEELKDVEMTRAGLDSRRNMWILAFGVTKLDGRDIVKPYVVAGKYDPKATAKARKAVISAMSPAILNRLMRMHGIFSMQLDRLVESPNSGFLAEP